MSIYFNIHLKELINTKKVVKVSTFWTIVLIIGSCSGPSTLETPKRQLKSLAMACDQVQTIMLNISLAMGRFSY